MRSPVDDLDFLGSMAGAYDDDAQRWLAWDQEGPVAETRDWFFNVDDANREHMHEHLDDSAGHRYLEALEYRHLIVVDRDHGRYAGAVQLFEDCQVNAWLAPHFRGRNLGADLFAAAAKMAHQHLAVKELYAVVAEQNLPALSALRLAGFQHAPATTETAELQPGLLALRHRTRFAQTC
ncbi:GNAT family N-acetyltransferase [Streptacidiphilus neutrinimicus]|uniref:GNAT family N-acetyltransferase n=1 Tax=Streptacidiphilus neutrinimicus TaxID=105420 RepID=UPI000AE1B279|nr:GNAT family N-acetyltransferase [Streptacidiphilus neutrinimicus]